jgi:uroporphyrinogen-III synthase
LGVTRVLVTRPEPGATRTVERLTKLGYEAIKLPLSETSALDPKPPVSKPDIVIATSAQAFLHLPKEMTPLLGELPTYLVGTATATAAREAGFRNVLGIDEDVERLQSRLAEVLEENEKVLYLCGRVRRPELEQALAQKGASLETIEVYDTILVSHSTDKLKTLISEPIDAVLVTSVTNADGLARMLATPEIGQAFDKSMFICFSDRIATQLKLPHADEAVVCSTPDEDGMIETITRYFPQ